MSVMIQIRNVPQAMHRTLKSRAALAGMSLSEYLLRELRAVAERPTPEEMLDKLSGLEPVHTAETFARAVRHERDSR